MRRLRLIFMIGTVALCPGLVRHLDAAPMQQIGQSSFTYLRDELAKKIEETEWAGGVVMAAVRDVSRGVTILDMNSDASMAPGSLAKILVSMSAIDSLGPQFRFETEIMYQGSIERKKLDGAIIIRGSGDPTIGSLHYRSGKNPYRIIDDWARAIEKVKIKTIMGPILVDDSAFDDQLLGTGWPLERLGDPDIPEISALNFNDNVIDLDWKKGRKKGKTPDFDLFPVLKDYFFVSNSVILREEPPHHRTYRRDPDTSVVAVNGFMPLKTVMHEKASIPVVVSALDGSRSHLLGAVLKARLAKEGVKLQGKVMLWNSRTDPQPNALAPISILTHHSPPLEEIIGKMLTYDRNLDAEVILKRLSQIDTMEPGSFEGGVRQVLGYLDSIGFPMSRLQLLDGSGLSRLSSVPLSCLMESLKMVELEPRFSAIRAGFATTGLPGAMENRFAGYRDEDGNIPRVEALGSHVDHSYSIGGWATSRGGHPIAFVFSVKGSTLADAAIEQQVNDLIYEITRSMIQRRIDR